MNSIRSKISSSDAFWDSIEKVYGEVDKFIKNVLQVNGFNSFLALKGIRYDDKQEFFQSLEMTVREILHSDYETQEKSDLEAELIEQHQTAGNFKLRPGHRNFIMNLMLEVENTDVREFFGRCYEDTSDMDEVKNNYEKEISISHPYSIAHRSPSKQIILSPVDHGYSRDDHEYILEEEEEYLMEDTMDSIGIIKVGEVSQYESDNQISRRRKRKSSSMTQSSTRRRPDHMYNEDFMAKCVNPRKRRVTLNKSYPRTDEGTRERFADLIQQSLQCILPTEKLPEIEGVEINVEKDSPNSWAVKCPLCVARIRLPIVEEGNYLNYKRSNFERHLRFKHCKTNTRDEIYETVEMVEEVVE